MKLTAIVVASLFHVATLKELPDYSREELAPKGLQLADYEAGAEIDPDKEVPDGVPVISDLVEGDFYQGDADLTDDQKAVGSRIEQRELTELEMRQAWVGQRGAERFKWKQSSDGKVYVPYTFQNYNSYTAKERANIAGAFEQYEQKTCIRMIERTNQADYVEIYKGSGCSSNVGKVGGKQQLSLASGCLYDIGTPFHEFMHAIGYLHEQSRSDRDKYVRIIWQNIPNGVRNNFEKDEGSLLQGLPYDTGSVMHYDSTAFGNGRVTIESLTGATLGQRNGPSASDVKGINMLYCGGSGGSGTTNPTKPTTACDDANSNCPGWSAFCNDETYEAFMEKNCQKTCKICGAAGECTDKPTESIMAAGWTCPSIEKYAAAQLPRLCASAEWKAGQICGTVCKKAGVPTDPDC